MKNQNQPESPLKINALTIEYQKKPLGFDEAHPRFSWKMTSTLANVLQTAYQIIVETEGRNVWDTDRVSSDASTLIPYEGEPLRPETLYHVMVIVRDNYGNSASEAGFFETGLGKGTAFSGEFITGGAPEKWECPVIFKSIRLKKPLFQARLYATALGLYRFDINKTKVGDLYLAPYWTDYKTRLEYQTYDITSMLSSGVNLLEMTLAGGWYQGVFGLGCTPNNYGDTVAGLAELHLLYASREIIATDRTWDSRPSWIRSTGIYHGENQDFTADLSVEYPVKVVEFDKKRIIAQENEPVRVVDTLRPIRLLTTPKGETVLDFGQNHSGIIRFRVDGKKGQKIVLRHAEVLDPIGNFYTVNLRRAKATDTFILAGGVQELSPEFTFHGFRFLAVEGMDVNLDDFVSLALSSDLAVTGSFVTSNPDIDRLQKNIVWGQVSNFVDVPTDCPQRDERLGWTADCQVFAPTAAFNRHVALFYGKWLRDLASDQRDNGIVPHVIPNLLSEADGAAVWSDAAVIVPWVVFWEYGDKDVLERQWKSMTKWVDHVTSKTIDGLWVTGFQYGDWLALDVFKPSDVQGGTDRYFVANAYYLNSIDILVRTAEILGKVEAKEKYSRLYERTLFAFLREYVSPNGRLVCETQTAYTLALRFHLLKAEWAEKAAKKLAALLQKNDNHLLTGFAGTPHLCPVLSETGFHSIANHLLMNDDYPSWLYEIKMGATTVWERWNGIKPNGEFFEPSMNSFNHYAYGSIGEWMYQYVAGISAREPGYKKIRIWPNLTRGLAQVRAEFDSPYGKIVSGYEVNNGKGILHVEIPVNTTAHIHVPGSPESHPVGSGAFDFPFETDLDFTFTNVNLDLTLAELIAMDGAAMAINKILPALSAAAVSENTRNASLRMVVGHLPDGQKIIEQIFAEIKRQANKN